MRDKLQQNEGRRGKYRATFSRFGRKKRRVPGKWGWYDKEVVTILLIDITDPHGNEICNHLWFNFTKGFEQIGLVEGCLVEFDARSNPYWKGYQGNRDGEWSGRERDYCLVYPTRIRKVEEAQVQDLPLFKQ